MTAPPPRRSRRSNEWIYVLLTIAAFVFTPEIRRVVDWRGGFDPLNAFSVIPLLMLCPIAILAFRRRRRLRGGPFAFIMVVWCAAFGYATLIAAAHGNLMQALYGIAQFCLPALVGVWLMTREETMEAAHARIARTLLVFAVIASIYGIIQYVFAPPWDTEWMQNIDAESFGQPERFAIRVFSVLNGPGVFALFLGAVILFNLPYLNVRNRFNMLALFFITVALMLTLVRSAWLAVMVGIAIFVWLSPKRLQAVLSVASVVAVCGVGVMAIFIALPGASTGNQVSSRFSTLSDIKEDPSALERQRTAVATLQSAVEQPAGAGLGLTGGSSKLGSGDAIFSGAPDGAIDNGFVSRFFEMGVPGFALFLIGSLGSVVVLGQAYVRFAGDGDRSGLLVTASCIATLVVIFAINASGDDQQGILGVLFFAALAIPLMPRRAQPAVERSVVPARAPQYGAVRSRAYP